MPQQRILATVSRDDFVGRDDELNRITRQALPLLDKPGLILLAAPNTGASELLRQSYDELFRRRGGSIPIHFEFNHGEAPAAAAARYFETLLRQFVAYRRVDSALASASATLREIEELALPGDFELVTDLIERFERERTLSNEQDFVRFCFNICRRLKGVQVFLLLDAVELAGSPNAERILDTVLRTLFDRSNGSFVLAGLRRHLAPAIHADEYARGDREVMKLDRLAEESAQTLLDHSAQRHNIEINEPTRDLIVQQLDGSPRFINRLLRAAQETNTSLTSFLNCQRLYVDELMGGAFARHYSRIVDEAAVEPQARKTLIRLLYESGESEAKQPSLWVWKKRLGVEMGEFQRMIDLLHVHELVNSSGSHVEVNKECTVWADYLRARYRLDVGGEARSSVVADALLATIRRAPQAMARKYRREAALGIRDLISRFDCQEVPASLFDYDRFAAAHKGSDHAQIESALEAETELIRLPQIIYTADCSAFTSLVKCDAERCAVGYGFEGADYTEEAETVWLAAEIESKLEASRELTETWHGLLSHLAREQGLPRARVWLIAPEGFSSEACAYLSKHHAYGSSRQQIEMLAVRVKSVLKNASGVAGEEYEVVIPMGEANELIAANAVEQIARRLNFRPDAINRMKTAVVEACINAAEHSLSPDRKIYQRIRVEDDKLIISIASRGVAAKFADEPASPPDNGKTRRGWGLKLIRTLMDEVAFERVDDGTQLSMVKYRT